MAEKRSDRHRKTDKCKTSGQFKILESEQVELLKMFDRYLADVDGHIAQKKIVSAKKIFRCFL